VSRTEQVGAGEKFFLLKKVFICNTSVNYMSVMAMKNITVSSVRGKSHIFLDVAWFTLSMNMKAKITYVVVMKIFMFINFLTFHKV
jgi:hypothetical protein